MHLRDGSLVGLIIKWGNLEQPGQKQSQLQAKSTVSRLHCLYEGRVCGSGNNDQET